MVEWFDQGQEAHHTEDGALQALRAFYAFRSQSTAHGLDRACAAIYPAHAGQSEAHRALRRAILAVAGAACLPTLTPEQRQELDRRLLSEAAMVGAGVGVPDADRRARVALEKARKGGRGVTRYPEPGFARLLARGSLLAQHRDLARMTPDALCAAAVARGQRVTRAQLARLEAGQPWREAPVELLVTLLGQEPSHFERRATVTHDTARDLAHKVLGVAATPRWFAELVAVHGDHAARACLRFAAAVAAVRPMGDGG